MKLHPIILCGGVGKRLWPISTRDNPKQFIQLFDGKSLFQKTLIRVSDNLFEKPIVVSSGQYAHTIRQQAEELNINYVFLEEPNSKNTSPSILLAMQYCRIRNIDNCLVLPSDHYITNDKYFLKIMKDALLDIQKASLTIFGVKPSSSSNQYGYMKVEKLEKNYKVSKFIEKPNKSSSKIFSKKENYFWNSGIFMFSEKILSQNLLNNKNTTYLKTRKIFNENTKVDQLKWAKLKNISFDYDVVEKIKNIRCVKYNSGWFDLGSLSLFLKKSDFSMDNSRLNKIYNSQNINLYNNSLTNVVISDLANIDVIFHGENLLIKNSKNSDPNKLFEKINKLDIENKYKTVTRPWGWFKTLSVNDNYHVKEICVNPHKKLSLQSHKKRRENWLVIEGTATVLRGNNKYILKKNESIQIDVNQKHRLENNTSEDIFLIEIQTGTYFGEDDIIRYTDTKND